MSPERPPYDDRYKRSSFRAYNEKLPNKYDTALTTRALRLSVMDDFVLEQLGTDLGERSILDVGCATGRLLTRLADAGARRLAGADLAPRILEVARRKLSGYGAEAELAAADAETALPWPDGSFDTVVTTGVMHHFLAPRAALREMRRVIRSDGELIIVDACFFSPLRQLCNLWLRIMPHDGDCRFHASGQMADLLERTGWRVARCERINWWAFGIVARPAG